MAFLRIVLVWILVLAGAAQAEPMAQMAGSWAGSGWARATADGPKEAVRCRITGAFDGDARTLDVTGRCVVPGRKLVVQGQLVGSKGSERITGRWANPDGIGRVAVVGFQRDGVVAFSLKALDPKTGRAISQTIEWRISDGTLRMRSSDRDVPGSMMADILFQQ